MSIDDVIRLILFVLRIFDWFSEKYANAKKSYMGRDFDCHVDEQIVELCRNFHKTTKKIQHRRMDVMRQWQARIMLSGGKIDGYQHTILDKSLSSCVARRIDELHRVMLEEIKNLMNERMRLGLSSSIEEFVKIYSKRYSVVYYLLPVTA